VASFSSSNAFCLSLFCEPKPYGRWQLPFSCGNHVPFCDDAFWAGKYEACVLLLSQWGNAALVRDAPTQPDGMLLYTIHHRKVKAIFVIQAGFFRKFFCLVSGRKPIHHILWFFSAPERGIFRLFPSFGRLRRREEFFRFLEQKSLKKCVVCAIISIYGFFVAVAPFLQNKSL